MTSEPNQQCALARAGNGSCDPDQIGGHAFLGLVFLLTNWGSRGGAVGEATAWRWSADAEMERSARCRCGDGPYGVEADADKEQLPVGVWRVNEL
jgi:hypothetical protein